jgi:hypothetical protein
MKRGGRGEEEERKRGEEKIKQIKRNATNNLSSMVFASDNIFFIK